ncbi:MAG: glycosyltransferase family 39 protein [Steroidobacteraceae bacterium]|jgi:4-amino-4-deoxy-L-arabinose transferase-like glycosyltransferase|nr:glycosyltransferase family 39 protein [Steroidobacteraceae bacterium]
MSRRRDLAWLGLGAVALLGAGLGMREPWPADEPRFALIARDMLANGSWFVPMAGGDLYADKPPVFFWAIAAMLALTGSLQVAFLLPALLAGLGTLWLVYDLARRVWSHGVGIAAACLLLFTVQFTLQAKTAQIDGFLVFWTTLGLYGIARHLLLGPDWRWYAIGGFAAGIGVITKGVGFLPLLLPLVASLLARTAGVAFPGRAPGGGSRWALAPLAALAAICLWFVPMLVQVAASGDPAYAAYRDEILFKQTVTRYAQAWHHHKPFWFYFAEVLPTLWLPAIALLPWAVPRWREHWRGRDGRALLFLAWALVVVLFFSFSSGKRGVYVLPAVPAFVLALAPFLPELWRRAGVQRLAAVLAIVLGLVLAAAAGLLPRLRPELLAELRDTHGVVSLAPLWAVAAVALVAVAAFRFRRGAYALAATLAAAWLVKGFWIDPMIDDERSAHSFMARAESMVPADREFGLLAYREQFLLQSTRPSVNFGHARWKEGMAEVHDGARWLNAAPGRVLLVSAGHREACFAAAPARLVGEAGRQQWFLVEGPHADPACAAHGSAATVRHYRPAL